MRPNRNRRTARHRTPICRTSPCRTPNCRTSRPRPRAPPRVAFLFVPYTLLVTLVLIASPTSLLTSLPIASAAGPRHPSLLSHHSLPPHGTPFYGLPRRFFKLDFEGLDRNPKETLEQNIDLITEPNVLFDGPSSPAPPQIPFRPPHFIFDRITEGLKSIAAILRPPFPITLAHGSDFSISEIAELKRHAGLGSTGRGLSEPEPDLDPDSEDEFRLESESKQRNLQQVGDAAAAASASVHYISSRPARNSAVNQKRRNTPSTTMTTTSRPQQNTRVGFFGGRRLREAASLRLQPQDLP